jgi:hypothetical protein
MLSSLSPLARGVGKYNTAMSGLGGGNADEDDRNRAMPGKDHAAVGLLASETAFGTASGIT